jgi:hypothetical protein
MAYSAACVWSMLVFSTFRRLHSLSLLPNDYLDSAHDSTPTPGCQLSVDQWAQLVRPLRYNQGCCCCCCCCYCCRLPMVEWCGRGQDETGGRRCFGRAVAGATAPRNQSQKYTRSRRLIHPRPLARQRSTVPVSNSVASLLPCKQRAAAQHDHDHDGRRVFLRVYTFLLIYQTWRAPHPLVRYPVTCSPATRLCPTQTAHTALLVEITIGGPTARRSHSAYSPTRPLARPLPPWTRATSPSRSRPSSASCTPSSTILAFPAMSATLAKQR